MLALDRARTKGKRAYQRRVHGPARCCVVLRDCGKTPATVCSDFKYLMADPARFELTTSAFGGQRSIQLSYGCGPKLSGLIAQGLPGDNVCRRSRDRRTCDSGSDTRRPGKRSGAAASLRLAPSG